MVPAAQFGNEIVRRSSLGRGDDFLVCGIAFSVSNIFSNAGVEQYGLLQNHSKLAAQVGNPILTEIDAIEQHLAFCRIVETHDEVQKSRFPSSGGAYDSDPRSSGNFE